MRASTLLKQNNITAQVLTDWDRSTNKNCKFEPGDTVRLTRAGRKASWISGIAKKMLNSTKCNVIAVTTVGDGRIRNYNDSTLPSRRYTKYYVANPKNNRVFGIESCLLQAA